MCLVINTPKESFQFPPVPVLTSCVVILEEVHEAASVRPGSDWGIDVEVCRLRVTLEPEQVRLDGVLP